MSHDLAYYRYYDRIVSLYEKGKDLKRLVQDLKAIPEGTMGDDLENFLQELERQYQGQT